MSAVLIGASVAAGIGVCAAIAAVNARQKAKRRDHAGDGGTWLHGGLSDGSSSDCGSDGGGGCD